MPEDRLGLVGAAEIVAGKLVSNRSDGGAVMTRDPNGIHLSRAVVRCRDDGSRICKTQV